MLGLLLFTCPPTLVLRGKNVVVPSLPLISLKDSSLDFLLNYFVNYLIKRFGLLPDQASVEVVHFSFFPRDGTVSCKIIIFSALITSYSIFICTGSRS